MVLFDSLGATFSIGEIVKSNLGGWESLPSLAADENGAGYHLNCKILPTDKIRVKVIEMLHPSSIHCLLGVNLSPQLVS